MNIPPETPVHQPRRVLVTGGAGFIGSNFIHYLADLDGDIAVFNLDALTYAGSLYGLDAAAEKLGDRYSFIQADIRDRNQVADAFAQANPDTIIHFAAESHVDRSIDDPLAVVETNVIGTANLLHQACAGWKGRRDVRFHHVSTDEVFGALGQDGCFSEDSSYDPSSPYSASKAGADHLVRAWRRTYGLPVTLSNCSNNYGPRQFPEKLIPLAIARALAGRPIPVYGDGGNRREWLYVMDHCDGIWTIVTQGETGRSYNIGGNHESSNLELVRQLCDMLEQLAPPREQPYCQLIAMVPDRPGHDFRYAIDSTRMKEDFAWQPAHSFADGLRETVRWYIDNRDWLEEMSQRLEKD